MCSCNNLGYMIKFTSNSIGNSWVCVDFLDLNNIHMAVFLIFNVFM